MNYTPPGQDPRASVNVIGVGAIDANELVTLYEDGKVRKTSIALGVALENNTTAGLTNAYLSAADAGNNSYLTSLQECVAALSDGNFAYAYSGDGSTQAANVNVKIKTPTGGTVLTITASTDSSINQVKILPLAGRFVLLWGFNTVSLKYAVYSNDGTQIKAPALLATVMAASAGYWAAAALTNDTFAVQYSKTGSAGVCFQRFDNAGIAAGAEVVVEAGAIASISHATLACANGDFIVYYCRNTVTTTYKFARYSAAGAVVIALTSMNTHTTALTSGGGGYHQSIAELPNGNIVFIACSTLAVASSYPYAHVYTAAGAFIRAVGYPTSTVYTLASTITPVIATADGFAVIGWTNDSNIYLRTYDQAGFLRNGPVGILLNHSINAAFSIAAFESGNSLSFVVSGNNSGNGTFILKAWSTDLQGVLKGSALTVETVDGNGKQLTGAVMSANKILAFTYKQVADTNFRTYRCTRCSVLGVTQSGAADGGTLPVATKGSYQLASNYSAGGTFDQRTAVVPGTKGFVAGQSAVLLGYT
ncbi:MAG: hypothetical protein H7Z39_20630 [Burkholderiaceae bacterium]|nr:hypothetical protein [Burkholderiaceae bacterium]